jgi:hypothetical protein
MVALCEYYYTCSKVSVGFHCERLIRHSRVSVKYATILCWIKSIGLISLPDLGEAGDTGAILRLNEAGRRYLVEDGSFILKGVEVLGRVNNDTDCVFLHLLENPRLCDRSAVEIGSIGKSNSSSTSPTASSAGGKREQPGVHNGMACRKRLA